MATVEELIGEELYGDLLAEGTTAESFARIADRILAARTEGAEAVKVEILSQARLLPHGYFIAAAVLAPVGDIKP
jgi:hypothetical protein